MNYEDQMLKGVRRTIDNQALTLGDIATETGRPRDWASRYAEQMVVSGKWEQVWKNNGKRTLKAYRPKRHA